MFSKWKSGGHASATPAAPRGLNPELFVGLGVVALAAVCATIGAAGLFSGTSVLRSQCLLVGGVSALLLSAIWTLQTLGRQPCASDDCEHYGRHMVGLTFLLVLTGLCNAVGTSMLALQGGLGFSAAALIEASDPKRIQEADDARDRQRAELAKGEDSLFTAQQLEKRAAGRERGVCATDDTAACGAARAATAAAHEAVEQSSDELYVLEKHKKEALANCQARRDASQHALCFLLSLSAVMSLFGAVFYVVNCVRVKRPLLADSDSTGSSGELSSSSSGEDDLDSHPVAAATVSLAPASALTPPTTVIASVSASADATSRSARVEPFDVHAFWSGAFFRVGEAVLFTFAFFWLLWTSNLSVVGLPVIALFVGMFVRTGEMVIARLGVRVLLAVEALLPASAPAEGSKPATREPTASGATTRLSTPAT